MQEDIVSIYSMSDNTFIKLISQLVPHLWSTSLWPSSPDGQLFPLIHQSFHQQMLSFLVIPFWLPWISRLVACNSGTPFECHTHYIFRFFIWKPVSIWHLFRYHLFQHSRLNATTFIMAFYIKPICIRYLIHISFIPAFLIECHISFIPAFYMKSRNEWYVAFNRECWNKWYLKNWSFVIITIMVKLVK
jgi:hypothetical protein